MGDVKGVLLRAGSCVQVRFANSTRAGSVKTPPPPAINPCQGNPVTTAGSSQPWYSMKTGTGNIDVTLNAVSANIILDAAVFDQGKLTSEYPISFPPSSSPGYIGPLLPGTQPTARLLLSLDTGNITLHKA